MQWLPIFLIVPALGFVGAYGIQKRKAWAWYGGWVVSFFVAGSVSFYTIAMLFNAETASQIVSGIVFTVGGATLWTYWAVWWATHRDEFIRK